LEVNESVDQPEQVVRGNMLFERELIEQRSLFDLPMSHHDLQSCQLDRLNHRSLCAQQPPFSTESAPSSGLGMSAIPPLSGGKQTSGSRAAIDARDLNRSFPWTGCLARGIM
jgi:hypothetical protein